MRKLKESTAAKVIAILLMIVFSAGFVLFGAGTLYCVDQEFYEQDYVNTNDFEAEADSLGHEMMWILKRDPGAVDQMNWTAKGESFKLYYVFRLGDEVIFSNHTFKEPSEYVSKEFEYIGKDGVGNEKVVTYTLDYAMNEDSAMWQHDLEYAIYEFFVPLGSGGIVLCILFGIVWLMLFAFYMSAAGHKKNIEGIYLSGFDKIPLDVLLMIYILIFVGGVFLSDATGLYYEITCFSVTSQIIAIGTLCGAAETLILLLFGSFAVRIKARTWWKNTVIFRILRILWKTLCAIGRALRSAFRALPLLWKTITFIAGILMAVLILFYIAACGAWVVTVILSILLFVIFAVAVCVISLQLQKLRTAGERLAAGDLEYKTPVQRMFWDFKKHAENLNSVSDVLGAEVDQRMRSERMKTELITNVSHDIKTPLTSIINYVDLLKKPHSAEDEQQYLDVLDRQSRRMKKLMEDLMEASKASSGSIAVSFELINVGELLRQSLSEYEERFEKSALTPVVQLPEKELVIRADGKLLWRVMDNLLGNACKYAQPHTRVYLSAAVKAANIVISVKNISAQMLNIDAEELMERFVRGDEARNTEGSGLGLNIARSLTELQGGILNIEIDGDLFKAELHFAEHTA